MSQFPPKTSGKSKTYAGIGSQATPHEILDLERRLAKVLAKEGWTLRSGHARGSDLAFEEGAASIGDPRLLQIFVPFWRGVEKQPWHHLGPALPAWNEANRIAALHHPGWTKLPEDHKILHARNSFQVLGPELNDPVDMVVCWTEDGAMSGGTAQALRIATQREIPIFNLGAPGGLAAVKAFLDPVKMDYQAGDVVRLRSAPGLTYVVTSTDTIAGEGETYVSLESIPDKRKACWKPQSLELVPQEEYA